MNWSDSVLSLIDPRSFSNLWFWIMLAVAWSSATHFIIGVPFDMIQRARRQGGAAQADLEALVAIQVRRRVHILSASGVWLVALWTTLLSAVAVLGFWYGHELAQALTLLLAPLTLASALGMRLAQALALPEAPSGEALNKRLTWHRVMIQAIGLLAILVTTMWGTWHNLSVRALGG